MKHTDISRASIETVLYQLFYRGLEINEDLTGCYTMNRRFID